MISMDIEYIKNNYIFEKLNENHNLDDFECESEDLTKFLKEDALNQQNMNLSLTHVVICDETVVRIDTYPTTVPSQITTCVKLKFIFC